MWVAAKGNENDEEELKADSWCREGNTEHHQAVWDGEAEGTG